MSDLLDRTLGERIKVQVDLAADTWPTYVDPHQLENAIVNLAVNGRDAMSSGRSATAATPRTVTRCWRLAPHSISALSKC